MVEEEGAGSPLLPTCAMVHRDLKGILQEDA